MLCDANLLRSAALGNEGLGRLTPHTHFVMGSKKVSRPNVKNIFSRSFRVYGLHSRVDEGCSCVSLVFCCLMGARSDACREQIYFDRWASILETAENAMYSSLRRKKSHSQPGDMLLRPEHEWTTLASGAMYFGSYQPFESKHDFVTCAARGRCNSKVRREAWVREVGRMHEVRIEHDERYLARPWGAICSCGWKACGIDELEIEQAKRMHLERAEAKQ